MRWIRESHAERLPLNLGAVRRRAPEILAAAFSLRPFWGWRRALEAAGLGYDRIRVELEETVRCVICGWDRASLTAHLWRQHEFAAGEYQEAYPGAEIHSEAMRARRGLAPSGLAPHWEPIWSREYILDRVSYYQELGLPLNRKAVQASDPPLMAMAQLLVGSWDEILRMSGVEPGTVRLVRPASRFSRDDVLARIRERAAAGLPMNAAAVCRAPGGLWSAAYKHFGSYRKAIAAAGLSTDRVYLFKRYDTGESRQILARVRRVALLTGPRHARALDELHRRFGSYVQQKYGGWRELARQLGVSPRLLVRRRGWDRAAVLAALRERKRRRRSLRPGDIHVEDKGLYLAVVRYFGTFEDCYDQLGYPRPRIAPTYRRELRDPRVLLASIRRLCRRPPAQDVVTGTDMVRYTRLAWLSRHHFGSWDAGLRRAGVTGLPLLDRVRYADPATLDADLARLVRGRLRASPERRRALFRYAERLRGSVVGALESAGATRARALSIRASPWPEYPTGRSVLAAIERRRRENLPLTHAALFSGRDPDRPLARAAKFLFGSWTEALAPGRR